MSAAAPQPPGLPGQQQGPRAFSRRVSWGIKPQLAVVGAAAAAGAAAAGASGAADRNGAGSDASVFITGTDGYSSGYSGGYSGGYTGGCAGDGSEVWEATPEGEGGEGRPSGGRGSGGRGSGGSNGGGRRRVSLPGEERRVDIEVSDWRGFH